MAGHYSGILMTGHIVTNTPKFVPPRWGRPGFDPTQTGLCKFGCGFADPKGLGKGERTANFGLTLPRTLPPPSVGGIFEIDS